MSKPVGGRWKRTGQTLGEGGQAAVYVVEDVSGRANGQFAAKVLLNPVRAPRLAREIETMRRVFALGVPVLEVVDAYVDTEPHAERPWFVTPIAVEGSLRTKLVNGSPYGGSVGSALKMFSNIAGAVRALHRQRVAHRDLKPENILIDGDRVVLADLGLCMPMTEADASRVSEVGERIGSVHYMPKEAFSRLEIDERQYTLDAYALGKLLYELVAGQRLFGFESPTSTANDLSSRLPRLLASGLNRTLRGLLHDEPTNRQAILEEIEGQATELIEIAEQKAQPPAAGDLDFASTAAALSKLVVAPSSPAISGAMPECEQLADDILRVWTESTTIAALDRDIATPNASHVILERASKTPKLRAMVTAPFTRTRFGTEPLEDKGYPKRPGVESGCAIGLRPIGQLGEKIPECWLCALAAHIEGMTIVALAIATHTTGPAAAADMVPESVAIVKGSQFDATLPTRVEAAAVSLAIEFGKQVRRRMK